MTLTNEQNYLKLVALVIASGYKSSSRAGNTYSLPGQSINFSLHGNTLPLLTTRRMFPAGVIGELAAFVRGAEDLATFRKFGCNYWDANAANWAPNKGKPESEWQIGKSYGSLWRNFHGVDQLGGVIEQLQINPDSRRHVVTAWDPSAEACLPSCHIMFQFYVRAGFLHTHMYMRSVDLCVGLPSDALLYAVLANLVARETRLRVGQLTFSFGDAHVYENHLEQFINVQARRDPLPAPTLAVADNAKVLTFEPDDIEIYDYEYHPAIKYAFNA